MLDAYLFGTVSRISPEAPVPVVEITKRDYRLGGAANVLLNLQSLGARPFLASLIGNDAAGNHILDLFSEARLSSDLVFRSEKKPTTQKTRIISQNQHILRVDEEDKKFIDSTDEAILKHGIEDFLNKNKIDVIIFEDYDKGLITERLINFVVSLAEKKGIPTAVDPKKTNFLNYKEVTLFKPNLKEIREGLKLDISPINEVELQKAAQALQNQLNHKASFITLSGDGVYLHSGNEQFQLPAHRRKIIDVSGAGDTVIAVAALCLALKMSWRFLAEISNIAGGLVCEEVGVVSVDLSRLKLEAQRLLS